MKSDWRAVVAHASDIVLRYGTGVTLRQLFYRLVADETLPNTISSCKGLSRDTGKARRDEASVSYNSRVRSITAMATPMTISTEITVFMKDGYAHHWGRRGGLVGLCQGLMLPPCLSRSHQITSLETRLTKLLSPQGGPHD
jgi:hypothetical protein